MGTIGDFKARFDIAMNEALKQPSKKEIEAFWVNGFINFMKSKDYAGVSNRLKGTGEVLRANFGSNDGNAESNIKSFLKEIGGIIEKDYDILYIQVGMISSDFSAYRITFKKSITDTLGKSYKKGDFITITNRYKIGKTGLHSVIGRKDLTPDSLKITKNTYKSASHLLSIVSPSIYATGYPENYIEFIIKSTEEIINNSANAGKFKDFESYSNSSTDIEYKITPELFQGIDQLSINNFQNDYGEILGGFALLNVISDIGTGLSFPQNSNEKLVDFYFDGYSVSSKGGKGGTPTGDTVIQKIHKMYVDTIIQPDGTNEINFFNNMIVPWVNPPKLAGSNTYGNIMNLASINITDKKNSGYWFLSEKSKLGPDQLTQDAVILFLDEMSKDKDAFRQFISELWTKSGMQWNKNKLDEYTSVSSKTYYDKLGRDRIGVVFYAIHVEVSKTLNDLYANELTKFAQMATNIKQLYLDVVVKSSSFKFRIVPFKTANFKFIQKGSMTKPFNSNMGVGIY